MNLAHRRFWFLPILVLVVSLFVIVPVLAQGETGDTVVDIETDAEKQEDVGLEIDEELEIELGDEELDGIEIEEVTKTPSGFGLWWRGVREQLSLVTTLDPVKKAEKHLKFAEERMQIAERLVASSDDPKVQERAQKAIERANKFIEKVEKRKDKFLDKVDDRKQRLLKNIATHQIRKEKVLDRIEEKIPEERFEQFGALRDRAEQGSRRLLNAIDNENIPDKVREHLMGIKERIETHRNINTEHREKKRELMKAAKDGDEEAVEKIKDLHDERKQKLHDVRADFKIRSENLNERAAEGDEDAKQKLMIIREKKEKVISRAKEVTQKRTMIRERTQSAQGGSVMSEKKRQDSVVPDRVLKDRISPVQGPNDLEVKKIVPKHVQPILDGERQEKPKSQAVKVIREVKKVQAKAEERQGRVQEELDR
jgi:hypothetical protein